MNLLSFIIPCYNSGLFLDQAIQSIYNQKNLLLPFEVICCDDFSIDNTLEILNKYKKQHSNFRYYRHYINMGGGAARNTCVLNSNGNLIFCLDSDNILKENSVNDLIEFMFYKNCQACGFHKIHYFYDEFTYSHTWRLYHNKNWVCDKECLVKTFKSSISSGNYLYTRKLFNNINGYSEDLGAQDTWDFGLRHLVKGYDIAICPKTYYWHRCHKDSFWIRGESLGINNVRTIRVYRKIIDLFEDETKDILKSDDIELNFSDLLQNKKIKLKFAN